MTVFICSKLFTNYKKQEIILQGDTNLLNVSSFGAKGDGKTNDTNSLQKALDSLSSQQALLFPPGDYLIDNLVIPNTENITLYSNGTANLIANNPKNKNFLVASEVYVNNNSYAGFPLKIENINFSGQNKVENSCVLQSWNSTVRNSVFSHASNGLKWTANTINGKLLDTTLVNNRIENCTFSENTETGLLIKDTSRNKLSDMFIINNFSYENGIGMSLDTSAGTLLSGNHNYGNTNDECDLNISYAAVGLRVTDNYFEGRVKIQDHDKNAPQYFTNNVVVKEK